MTVSWAPPSTPLPAGREVALFGYRISEAVLSMSVSIAGAEPITVAARDNSLYEPIAGIYRTAFETPGPVTVRVTAYDGFRSDAGSRDGCIVVWEQTFQVGSGGVAPGQAAPRFKFTRTNDDEGQTATLAPVLLCSFYRPARLVATLEVRGRKPWRAPFSSMCDGFDTAIGGRSWVFGWDGGPSLTVMEDKTEFDSERTLPFVMSIREGRRVVARIRGAMEWTTITTTSRLTTPPSKYERDGCSLNVGSIRQVGFTFYCEWTMTTAQITRRR